MHESNHVLIVERPYAVSGTTERFSFEGVLRNDARMIPHAIGENDDGFSLIMLDYFAGFIDVDEGQHEIRLALNGDSVRRTQRNLRLNAPYISIHSDGISLLAVDEFALDDGTSPSGAV